MGRTRSSTLALVAAATGAVTWGVLSLLDSRGTHLAPVLWVVAPVLVVVAALVLWAAGAITIRHANPTSAGRRPIRSDSSVASTPPTAGQNPTTVIILAQVSGASPRGPSR